MSRTHTHIPWFCTPHAKFLNEVDWRTPYETPMNAWYESVKTIPRRKIEQYEKNYSERRIRRKTKHRWKQILADEEMADDANLYDTPERKWFW